MPLSNNSEYGVRPMSEAINKLPATATTIRQLGLFKKKPLRTTSVKIEAKDGKLSLVEAVPRGTPGEPVKPKTTTVQSFEIPHLPKHDVVMADDVQNLKEFGTDNKPAAVAAVVAEKLADMKADIEYTEEHMMLGALKGKILNADGEVLLDIYDRFGIARKVHDIALSSATTLVGKVMDKVKIDMRTKLKGESVEGWYVLAGVDFFQELTYHKSIYELYQKYQNGKVYIDGQTYEVFSHQGVDYILYDHEFESGEKIGADEGLLVPKGTRKTFFEYFAPANTSSAVNTTALPYYASREKLGHDKGWDLEAQSNPLPLVLRPELCATLKMT